MAIKLRVISDQHRELGEQRSRVFGVNGGSIGRAPDNDWILPDAKRVVSGHHCEIEYRSGAYWIKDISTNGVFINDAETPASETGPVALADGDRLRVGDYEIVVSVDKRTDFLPSPGEEAAAASNVDSGIGSKIDLGNLLQARDAAQPGSISVRNAYGIKVPGSLRRTRTPPRSKTSSRRRPRASRPTPTGR